MLSYATVDDYRLRTSDTTSSDELVQVKLEEQSAKLRAECRIDSGLELTDDATALARYLVVDAASKSLVTQSIEGIGEVDGVTQASFTANGFQQSFTLQNPSGTSYWDNRTLADFKRLLGRTQSIGIVAPFYGA